MRKPWSSAFVLPEEATVIVDKAEKGGEVKNSLEDWLKLRFLPNIVLIDEDGYSRMCIDALKILSKTAATDYGSSRQRDFGHVWADMTRGYLGELAFKLFLERQSIKVELAGVVVGIVAIALLSWSELTNTI